MLSETYSVHHMLPERLQINRARLVMSAFLRRKLPQPRTLHFRALHCTAELLVKESTRVQTEHEGQQSIILGEWTKTEVLSVTPSDKSTRGQASDCYTIVRCRKHLLAELRDGRRPNEPPALLLSLTPTLARNGP